MTIPSHNAHDTSPKREPGAWDYAIVASPAFMKLAVWLAFILIWIAVGLNDGISGFWVSLVVAMVLFLAGAITLVLIVPVCGLGFALAWLVGLGMSAQDRRRLIAEHHERDRLELQAALSRHSSKRRRNTSDGFLGGIVLGALIGGWWGDGE